MVRICVNIQRKSPANLCCFCVPQRISLIQYQMAILSVVFLSRFLIHLFILLLLAKTTLPNPESQIFTTVSPQPLSLNLCLSLSQSSMLMLSSETLHFMINKSPLIKVFFWNLVIFGIPGKMKISLNILPQKVSYLNSL